MFQVRVRIANILLIEINLAFLYKYQYIGIKVNSNMKERLLIKCDTTIYADEITNLLIENNIVSRQHMRGKTKIQVLMVLSQVLRYMFSKKIMKRLLR